MTGPYGPYDTEQQASAAVRRAYDALRSARPGDPVPAGEVTRLNAELFARACDGLSLGAYDRRILAWLAGYEPATCCVIAGLIMRAKGSASDAPT